MPSSLVTVVLEQHGVVQYLGKHLQSPAGIENFARALGGHLRGMDQVFLPAMLTIPAALPLMEDARGGLKRISDLLAAVVDSTAEAADRLAMAGQLRVLVEQEFQRERTALLPAAVLGLDPALSAAVAEQMEHHFLAYHENGPRENRVDVSARGVDDATA